MNRYLLLNIIRAVVVVFALTAMIALLFGAWAVPAFILMTGALVYDFRRRAQLYRRSFGGASATWDAETWHSCPTTTSGNPSNFPFGDWHGPGPRPD